MALGLGFIEGWVGRRSAYLRLHRKHTWSMQLNSMNHSESPLGQQLFYCGCLRLFCSFFLLQPFRHIVPKQTHLPKGAVHISINTNVPLQVLCQSSSFVSEFGSPPKNVQLEGSLLWYLYIFNGQICTGNATEIHYIYLYGFMIPFGS